MVTRPQPGNPVQTYQSINELCDRVTDLLNVNTTTQNYLNGALAAIASFNTSVAEIRQGLNNEAAQRNAGISAEAIGRTAAVSALSLSVFSSIGDVRSLLLNSVADERSQRMAAVGALNDNVLGLARTIAAQRYEYLSAAPRPGAGPSGYTLVSSAADLGGDPALLPEVPVSRLNSGDRGPVVRLAGAAILARRVPIACEIGRLYRARFVVQRRGNPSDPTGDSVACGLVYLDQSHRVIGQPVPLRTYPTLITANGRQECEALISASPGLGAGFTPPSSARFMVPVIVTYGLDAATDVEVLDISDVTDAFVLSPPVADFSGRLSTLETADLITRTERLEQEAGTPSKITFGSKGDAAFASIPDTVQAVELLGRQYAGDGGAGLYARVSGSIPDGADSFTSHGAVFLRVPDAPDIVVGQLNSGYVAWYSALPTQRPDYNGITWNNGGLASVTSAGLSLPNPALSGFFGVASSSPYDTDVYDSGRGTGKAAFTAISRDTTPIFGKELYGAWLGYLGPGSGDPSVIGSSFGAGVTNNKTNWFSTTNPGQTIGLHITTRGGYHGDQNTGASQETYDLFGGYYPGGDVTNIIINSVQSSPYAQQAAAEWSIHFAQNGRFDETGNVHSMNIQIGAMRQLDRHGNVANPGTGISVTAASGAMAYAYQALNTARPGTYGSNTPGIWGGFLQYVLDDGGNRAPFKAFAVEQDGSIILSAGAGPAPNKRIRAFNNGCLQILSNADLVVTQIDDLGSLYLSGPQSRLIINDNVVVGPQQGPISNASGPDDVVAAVNALLAAVRAHGLIRAA
ncbi:hypothetical protein [Methylobacterium fujisawaense]